MIIIYGSIIFLFDFFVTKWLFFSLNDTAHLGELQGAGTPFVFTCGWFKWIESSKQLSFALILWEISSSWRSYSEIKVYAHAWNDDFFFRKIKKNQNFEISSRGLESPSNSKTLIILSFFLSFFLRFFFNTWKNYSSEILLYESPRRKPGWRFTAGSKY